NITRGAVVTCTVSEVMSGGIEVTIAEGLKGFIRKSDLSRDRSEQRPDRFAVGEKVDAKVTSIDKSSRKISLSIKAREVEEEKQAMADYGSSDAGASLGDILGAALRSKQEESDDGAAEETPAEASEEAGEDAPGEASEEEKPSDA
ncbi:MAG: S1 RNA-binding domain-containing protein, partial [Pseudomonadota bacterium]|nr:S1 RNA-binding domain-containing protein [Pseudomonadota bacterium]